MTGADMGGEGNDFLSCEFDNDMLDGEGDNDQPLPQNQNWRQAA